MDEVMWIVGIGLVLTGVLIGYPLGHIGGKREAYRRQTRSISANVSRYRAADHSPLPSPVGTRRYFECRDFGGQREMIKALVEVHQCDICGKFRTTDVLDELADADFRNDWYIGLGKDFCPDCKTSEEALQSQAAEQIAMKNYLEEDDV